MKRTLILLGLPVLLGLVWWSGTSRSSATASVTIDTSKVGEVRGLVISRLGTIGATKTAEDTTYDDGGDSDLTFQVPPTRLEEALVELNLVGGVVSRQQVEFDRLGEAAGDVASGVDGVNGCLATVADRLRSGSPSAVADDVAECRRQLDATGKQLRATPEAAQPAVLDVHIRRRDTTSPALLVAFALLALAVVAMIVLTIRSMRGDRVYDITEPVSSRPLEDLYHRRN